MAYAMMWCPSVCLSVHPSVTFVDTVEMNKHIFKFFSPSGRRTIHDLFFHFKCYGSIPMGTSVMGALNGGGKQNCDS